MLSVFLSTCCMVVLVATTTATPGASLVRNVRQADAINSFQGWSTVQGQAGITVSMPCIIKNKEDNQSVIWVRQNDLHVISINQDIFTNDPRYSVVYDEQRSSWNLHLRYPHPRDSGNYECRLQPGSSVPILTTLVITQATSIIIGGPEMYVEEGSKVHLKCEFRDNFEKPTHVFWYHDGRLINYEPDRQISVGQTDNDSTLFISSLQAADSGNYKCVPANGEESSIKLHVLRAPSYDNTTPGTPVTASTINNEVPNIKQDEDGNSYYTMGEHTLKIPMTLHQENRERLVSRLQARGGYAPGSLVLLQGGENTHRPGSSDINYVFRQESYFHWAFGVLEPGWFGAIVIYSGWTILFMPRLPEEYAMWMGHIRTPEEYRHQYQVDEVYYVDWMAIVLRQSLTSGSSELLTLHGINSDSERVTLEATFDGISNFTVNNKVLHDEIAECRVHKTEAEIRVIRYATSVSCAAHREVMSKIRPGMKEYQLESTFQHHTYYKGGCRHHAYGNICGSGPSAAILHYGHAGAPNDRTIRDGDTIMLDMGAEYYCYASDVSVSYPANGNFSNDHKNIYNAVLAANKAVADALQPGVSWVEMHRVAYRILLEKLKEAGIVQGDLDEMMTANIGSIFMPHGLGHLLGVDVHDVGGYTEGHPSRPVAAGYRNLRTARIIEENMVLTIEPGCYFIDYILDAAFENPKQAQFLVRDEIERFRGFGGVRIEDNVLVTANGIENLTSDLPRTVDDIETFMADGREQDDCSPQ